LFQNRVLRRVFWPKRDKVTEEWRILHNVELSDLYFSPNIGWVIKSRRVKWAGQVTYMEERSVVYSILVVKSEGMRALGRSRLRWKITLRWIFRKWNVAAWTDWSWLGYGQVADTCECGNDPSGSTRCGEFLD
jgi:hypothetical protein